MGKKKFRLQRPKGKKKTSPAPPPPPPWIELPRDVTANILHRLGAIEILDSAQKVCTTWRSVCKDPAMWRVIEMRNLGDLPDTSLEIMCRHAVDRSQGQLIDINIEYFATDDLLLYISEWSSQLRYLRLAQCYSVSGEGMREAAKKFPLLEELHFSYVENVLDDDIEAVGRSCPLLRSFTFNVEINKFVPEKGELYARAVAKTMPNLRHLRLFGNNMTNEGLQAILDGCPHLESLDLRKCYHLDLGGDLGKRCAQQIKDLKRPNDSTAGYEWLFYDGDLSENESGSEFSDYLYSDGYSDAFTECDYDDYTNPFSSEYFPDHKPWFFDPFTSFEYDDF